MTYVIDPFVFDQSELALISNTGVYKMWHTSKPDEVYVGSTLYIRKNITWRSGLYTRWNAHISQLQRGKSSVKGMQKIVDRYGINGLKFQILEICRPKDCRQRELVHIELLNPSLNKFKGHKKIFQFSLDGSLIKVHKSMDDAAEQLKIDRGSINHCALGNRLSAGGFMFSFNKTIKLPEVRKVLKLSMNGELLEKYNSLGDAAKDMNLRSTNAIRNAIIGVQRQAYGFKWQYKTELGYSLSRLSV